MPSAALEIRSQLVNYLAGEIDFDQLDEWMSQNTWNIHKHADPEAAELAYAVEAKLAEYSGNHIGEERLRENLKPFVTHYKTAFASAGSLPQIGCSSGTMWQVAAFRVGEVVVDTSAVGALA